MLEQLRLSANQRAEMLAHVLKVLPEEACGILAGRGGVVEAVLPVTNQLHSPVRYYMEPLELLQCLHWMDEHNLEFLGVFHSHPNGPDRLSVTDLIENTYSGAIQIIWFPAPGGWDVRGYILDGKNPREIRLIWENDA
jgi:proteasome lid subunit RPN8/RPN11